MDRLTNPLIELRIMKWDLICIWDVLNHAKSLLPSLPTEWTKQKLPTTSVSPASVIGSSAFRRFSPYCKNNFDMVTSHWTGAAMQNEPGNCKIRKRTRCVIDQPVKAPTDELKVKCKIMHTQQKKFLDASLHLYARVRPSIRPSVGPSVDLLVRLSVGP